MKMINHEVDGLQVSQRIEDGYINLTQMAHANNKDLHDYLRLKTTKAFIKELSLETGIHGSKIIQVRKGRGNRVQQGTWGHPQVAIHCGQWCSARFAVLVSGWVVQWMTTGQSPIQPQATSTEISTDLTAIVEELENLIVSIRSHGRIIHLGSHQPVDQTLFKSLHTLSHNQLSIINATIQQLELLKRIAEMNNADEATAPTSQQTINCLFSSPPPTDNQGAKDEETKETEVSQNEPQQLTNINVKIPSSQRQWLADTARMVRQNNTKPVPPAERVYPQHLVSIAIQLLQNSAIDIEAAHSILQEQDEPTANINIKISRQQQEWLTTTAKTIRNDNQQPTYPSDRIYPQHLIAIAVAELQNAEIKWHRVENVSGIQRRLTTACHLHLV
jgi:hypothetical protein